MVPVMSLWMPIVVAAILVFVASSILHMVLPVHRNDMRKVPREDELLDAFRRLDVAPGDYGLPHPGSAAAMRDPAFQAKLRTGPVVYMTVTPGRAPSIASNLVQWFVYSVVVGVFAAYLAGRALGRGAPYLEVFRVAGCAAFVGYALALAQHSIWYQKSWTVTLKSMFDGLIYGLLTGGAFGWLWPR